LFPLIRLQKKPKASSSTPDGGFTQVSINSTSKEA